MSGPPVQDLRRWRDAQRADLSARRVAMLPRQRRETERTITRLLTEGFAARRDGVVSGYWPCAGEFDPRPALGHFKRGGARLVLPAVVHRGAALQFLAWWPGAPMRLGMFDLPVPDTTASLVPQTLLIPLLGFDPAGYRLGFGGGYFDRTLAAMNPPPLKIGVGFELSRIGTIHPQPYDVAMDFIVTEAGVQRVAPRGCVEPRAWASPVCDAQAFG